MKIDMLPRSYFEERRGSFEIDELLRSHKIISIQSSSGWDSEPPFAKEHCESKNLLCLVFDDYFGIPDDPVERSRVALFTPEHAERIMRFVDDGSVPLVVHCTQGVSRSGAVGYVLDRYFNSVLANNEKDYEYFMARNPFIMPNPNVVEVFLKFLEINT